MCCRYAYISGQLVEDSLRVVSFDPFHYWDGHLYGWYRISLSWVDFFLFRNSNSMPHIWVKSRLLLSFPSAIVGFVRDVDRRGSKLSVSFWVNLWNGLSFGGWLMPMRGDSLDVLLCWKNLVRISQKTSWESHKSHKKTSQKNPHENHTNLTRKPHRFADRGLMRLISLNRPLETRLLKFSEVSWDPHGVLEKRSHDIPTKFWNVTRDLLYWAFQETQEG